MHCAGTTHPGTRRGFRQVSGIIFTVNGTLQFTSAYEERDLFITVRREKMNDSVPNQMITNIEIPQYC